MKSLLVDALRQIEDEKSPSADTPREPAAPDDSSELELAPDGLPQPADASASEEAPVLDTGDLELAEDSAPDVTFDDEVHPLTSTMALDVEGAASKGVAATADSAVDDEPLTASKTSAGSPMLQRVAIYTPVLCLLLGSVSAGGYFGYSYVGAVNLNADLGSLPEHVSGQIDIAVDTSSDGAFILGPGMKAPVKVSDPPVERADLEAVAVPVPEEAAPTGSVSVASTEAKPEDLAYPILEKAYREWQADNLRRAERLYREALDIAPGHPNALSGLGAVLVASSRRQEAIPVYEELLALEPENVTAAAALLARGDDGTATIDEIQGLLVHHSRSAPLYFALGSALARESRWPDARVAFESAVEYAPGRADYAFNLAVSLEQVGRYRDAEAMYKQALSNSNGRDAVDPGVVVARLNELSSIRSGSRQ